LSSEKKKRKKSKATAGGSQVVRLSESVLAYLGKRQRDEEPLDATLRRLFGLPTKKGDPQPLTTVYVVMDESNPQAFFNKGEARGAAISAGVKKGTVWNKVPQVITCQEVP